MRHCLSCDQELPPGTSMIAVPLRGKMNGTTAYRHADDAECIAARRAADRWWPQDGYGIDTDEELEYTGTGAASRLTARHLRKGTSW